MMLISILQHMNAINALAFFFFPISCLCLNMGNLSERVKIQNLNIFRVSVFLVIFFKSQFYDYNVESCMVHYNPLKLGNKNDLIPNLLIVIGLPCATMGQVMLR